MAGYKKLFDISISHSFFNNDECARLSVVPISNTKNFFHKADLLFHRSERGISVSYNTGFTESLLAYKADDIKLIFTIKSKDPFFFNYTDLEHEHGKTLYFSSSLAHQDGDNLFLSVSDYVTADDERSISDEIFNDILTKKDRISVPVGIICIDLSNLIPDGKAMDVAYINHYTLRFNTRHTYWRYYVIQKNNIVFDDLIIKDSKQEITFSGDGKVKLSNGVLASQITSKQPISLKEFSDRHFDLIGIKDRQETILINRLDVSDIKMVAKDDNKKVSELYIYC
jgi:hypothetical protein